MITNKKKILLISILSTIFIGAILIIFSKKQEKSNNVSITDLTLETTNNSVSTQNIEIEKIKIHITGEVNSPGLIELDSGSRIADAIELAGGLTENADTSKTNLAYILSDGEKIYIPNFNDDVSTDNEQNLNSSSKININTGNLEELQKIPRSRRIYSKFNNRI